jgi:hypothetical protein
MTRGMLLAHAAATWAMLGLIWFVQVVHYPLFARVGAAGFPLYEAAHASRTTLVVGPLMVIELLTAVWLVATMPAGVSRPAAWLGLGLVAVIWLSTALLQVPQHNVLARGFDPAAHVLLVTSNWVRTMAWTLRGGLALWLLLGVVPASR